MENIPSSIFLAYSASGLVLVDTGFDPEDVGGHGSFAAQKRTESLEELLKSLGLVPEDVGDVIMTHLHWDHTAGMRLFPHARFHVQADAFRAFLCLKPNEETYYRPQHWLPLLDRMVLIEGDKEIVPGIRVRRTGGHCAGHQVVLVETEEGTLALAGDLPFDYSGLWSSLPADFWEDYRRCKGEKTGWSDEQWKRLRAFMKKNKLMDAPCGTREVSFSRLRRGCARILLTHDPGPFILTVKSGNSRPDSGKGSRRMLP
nr:N-acyl homoserine lactonase family protein [Desulfobotulus pelophilus]